MAREKNLMLIRVAVTVACALCLWLGAPAVCFATVSGSDAVSAGAAGADVASVSGNGIDGVDVPLQVEVTLDDSAAVDAMGDLYDVHMYILGILVFFVVVLLCKYTYKFFDVFF